MTECQVWRKECLGLKIGDKLESISDIKYRMDTWKENFWREKGKKGIVVKLNDGSPAAPYHITEDFPEGLPATPAWATLKFDEDPNATVAVNPDWQKDWKKEKRGIKG